jgi:hypothetical protein
MAKRHLYKVMPADELRLVQKRNWIPISFAGAAIPSLFKSIPADKLLAVYASGAVYDMRIEQLGDEIIPHVVAGYDVFRYDSKDESKGFPINKDHYIVIKDLTSDERFFIRGPNKIEGDHWFTELPKNHLEIEIIEFPSNDEDNE